MRVLIASSAGDVRRCAELVSPRALTEPVGQFTSTADKQHVCEDPRPGGGRRTMVLTQQPTDRVAGHGTHWEAGPAMDAMRTDSLGRVRVANGTSKAPYDG